MSRNFDDQLLRLRQRLTASTSVAAPPPVTRDDAGRAAKRPAAQPNRARTADEAAARRAVLDWAVDAPPTTTQAGPSLLDLVGNGPTSVPVVAESNDDDELRYVRSAASAFIDACASIEEFAYDASEEEDRALRDRIRRGARDPGALPRFVADPFDFRGAQQDGTGKAVAASGMQRHYAPAPVRDAQNSGTQEDGADTVSQGAAPVSTSAGSTSISAVEVLQRQQQQQVAQRRQLEARVSSTTSSNLYALPEDVARRHGVRANLEPAGTPGLERGAPNQRRASNAPRSSAASSVSAARPKPPSVPGSTPPRRHQPASPSPSVDFSQVKRVEFRDPANVVQVHDGRIAFCSACHRVVIGNGRGRCPHCHHINDVSHDADDDADAGGHSLPAGTADAAAEPAGGAVAIDARPLPANATVAEIEAEERRQFQAAVAAWRQGKGVAPAEAVADAEAPNAGSDAAAFERSARRIARDVSLRSCGGALYFSTLWLHAFPDAGAPAP